MNNAQAILQAALSWLVYLSPTVLALVLRSRKLPLIAAINVLLGCTGIGWIAAFVLAIMFRASAASTMTVQRTSNRWSRSGSGWLPFGSSFIENNSDPGSLAGMSDSALARFRDAAPPGSVAKARADQELNWRHNQRDEQAAQQLWLEQNKKRREEDDQRKRDDDADAERRRRDDDTKRWREDDEKRSRGSW